MKCRGSDGSAYAHGSLQEFILSLAAPRQEVVFSGRLSVQFTSYGSVGVADGQPGGSP